MCRKVHNLLGSYVLASRVNTLFYIFYTRPVTKGAIALPMTCIYVLCIRIQFYDSNVDYNYYSVIPIQIYLLGLT